MGLRLIPVSTSGLSQGPLWLRAFDRVLQTHWRSQALSSLNRWKGRRRAASWRSFVFPNLVLARAAKAKKREERLASEWKREELRRTPFAILDEPPGELRPRRGRK